MYIYYSQWQVDWCKTTTFWKFSTRRNISNICIVRFRAEICHRFATNDLESKLSINFKISHRGVCQTSEWSENSRCKSHDFKASRDLTTKRLIGYWNRAMYANLYFFPAYFTIHERRIIGVCCDLEHRLIYFERVIPKVPTISPMGKSICSAKGDKCHICASPQLITKLHNSNYGALWLRIVV